PTYELSEIAENIQDELEKINGVSTVDIIGQQEKEIHILVDPIKLEGYGLTLQDISNKLSNANSNLPVGVININQLNYSIRVDNRFQTLDELFNTPIITLNSSESTIDIITLRDIAKVEESYSEENRLSKLSINGEKSKRAVSLQINKKKGGNLIQI